MLLYGMIAFPALAVSNTPLPIEAIRKLSTAQFQVLKALPCELFEALQLLSSVRLNTLKQREAEHLRGLGAIDGRYRILKDITDEQYAILNELPDEQFDALVEASIEAFDILARVTDEQFAVLKELTDAQFDALVKASVNKYDVLKKIRAEEFHRLNKLGVKRHENLQEELDQQLVIAVEFFNEPFDESTIGDKITKIDALVDTMEGLERGYNRDY